MLEVEEKLTTFWHNIHPDKFDQYVNSPILPKQIKNLKGIQSDNWICNIPWQLALCSVKKTQKEETVAGADGWLDPDLSM